MKNIKIQKVIFEWVEELVFASVVVVLIFSFAFKIVSVSGDSMLPNYFEGDKLIISSFSGEAEIGDVVVIVGALDKPIIKRVIATEGQEIDIDTDTGTVYIDGEALDETLFGLENGITTQTYTSLDLTQLPQIVPQGCVFVLGDNRVVSEDSRYATVGMVDANMIIGEVVFQIYPVSEFGFIN
ncbi:MAG: signal peptidase I [Clostridia bacterium]